VFKLAEDISRKTVLILVSLAVVISVLSTFLVVNAVYNFMPADFGSGNFVGAGKVTLYVPVEPLGGKVTINVINPNENK